MNSDYIFGLDVSNGKLGYAAINGNNDPIRVPANHKLGISKSQLALGARIFEPGQPAVNRRIFRISTRRTGRKKMRIRYWKKIFEPEILKETGDTEFFKRMEESWMSPLDDRKETSTDVAVKITEPTYKAFPTIYHLRKMLMETDEKVDLRYIALAVHNIIKYPGNFLSKVPTSNYENARLDVKGDLEAINEAFADLDSKLSFDTEYSEEVDALLQNRSLPNKEKTSLLYDLLFVPCKKKEDAKINKKRTEALIKAILGKPFQLDVLLGRNELDPDAWKITFDSDSADEAIDNIRPDLSGNEVKVIDHIGNIFNAVKLSFVVKDGLTLSQAMVKRYVEYGHQLNLLKKYAKSCEGKKRRQIYDLYNVYCGNSRYLTKEIKKRTKDVTDNKAFAAEIKKLIGKDESEVAKEIVSLIDSDSFLIKLHTKDNGVIPYQLNELELNKILENQGKFYPFLLKKNPVEENPKWVRQHPYELDQLVAFRIPYFVGPLITPEDQKKKSPNKSGQVYAWMVRKEEGTITPWNFWKKVDLEQTAEAFIQRMVKTDSVLLEEKVLPNNSLLYQEFKVLDELNKVQINHKKINSYQKGIALNLFKSYKTVSKDRFVKELNKEGNFGKPLVVSSISGLADPKKFNNSLSTYNDFKKIFGKKIDDPKLRNDFENIVYWLSIFDDDDILMSKLNTISWLTDEQKKKVMRKNYTGWGRYSKITLTSLVDENGKSIIEKMREDSLLINQCLADPAVKRQIDEHNQKIAQTEDLDQILSAAYASPSVKKIIRQSVKLVEDVVESIGSVPKYFTIRSSRTAGEENQLAMSRQNKLRLIINKNKNVKNGLIDKKLVEEFKTATKDKRRMSDKEYIFFLQLGRDFFTGERIPYSQIKHCIVSHAVAPSLYSDGSMDNKVLIMPETARKITKSPSRMKQFGSKKFDGLAAPTVAGYWYRLQNMGLITKYKLYLLNLDENNVDSGHKLDYVRHAFVEHSQATKILSLVLKAMYPDSEVIQIRSEFVNEVRKSFSIYRSYLVNEHYLSTDAYIDSLLANYFLKIYPKLAPFYTYGKYMFAEDSEKAKGFKELHRMNLIWRLTNGLKDDDNVYQSGTNQVMFSRKEIIEKIRRVDNFKHVNLSFESFTSLSNLFKREILYPGLKNDTATSRSLVKKKKNMPTDIYGGYSYLTTAMIAIVRRKVRGGKYVNQYIKIPTLAVANVAQDRHKNPAAFKRAVKKYLNETIDGEFEILEYGLNIQTRIQDGDKDYYVRSDNRGFDTRQLMLSQKSRQVIQDYIEDPNYRMHKYESRSKDAEQELTDVYLEILGQLKDHWELWNTANFKEKILNSQEKFSELDFAKKKDVIYALLVDLKPNPRFIQFKETLGFPLVSLGPNKTVGDDAKIIFTSVSGLRTKVRKIYDPNQKKSK